MGMRFYVLDVNPEPWAIGDLYIGRRNGKLYPGVGQNSQLAAYKEAVREALLELEPRKLNGDIWLEFWFWRRLERYQTETIDGKSRTVQKNKPDVTNLVKATEDACQGVLFDNDRATTHSEGTMVQAGPDVHGAVIIGIKADTGLDLLAGLDEVALARLRELNEHKPPDPTEMEWGSNDPIF